MNVYIFHSNQWHLAGELKRALEDNHFEFSYRLDYAQEFVNKESIYALNSMFPVRLMEVFRGARVNQWLTQFHSLNLSNNEPNYCLGNVILTPLLFNNEERLSSASMPISQWLEATYNRSAIDPSLFNHGSAYGQPYWFVATDGNAIFPTRAIENDPTLVPIMMPIPNQNRFGNAFQFSFTQEDLSAYIEVLNWINKQINSSPDPALDSHSALPKLLAKYALPRFDIVTTNGRKEYLGVEKLHQLFDRAYCDANDLLEFLKKVVSAHQQKLAKFESVESFILSMLKRELVLRLFNSSQSITEIEVTKSELRYAFAPFGMELFLNKRIVANRSKKTLEWPYPIVVDNQIDIPILCDALSDLIEPHKLLLLLNDFAENIVGTYLPALGRQTLVSKSCTGLDEMTSFDQKLARWGLLI